MHDVGSVVDPWRHPQHSAYLIRNLSLLALTDREALLASLAAYLHEGDPVPEGWSKTWRPLLEPPDLVLAQRLGTLVAFAETLEGATPRMSLPRGSHRLVVTPGGGSGPAIPPRALERLRKPLRRIFDLELVTDHD
jgi:exopolyphosphatase/pppGpp-phosphohydrolase